MSDDLMTAFYAAVCAIEEGKIAECEVEHRVVVGESEITLTLTARREVKPYEVVA